MPRHPRIPLFRSIALTLAAALVAGCGASTTATATPAGSAGEPSTAPPSGTGAPLASPSADTGPSATTAAPTTGTSVLGSERLTLLLIGVDNTVDRKPSQLTDSVIVASLDPVAQTVSLLSLPRDLSDFPLPDGGTYRQKLNSLDAAIRSNPARYGGTEGDEPYAILAGVIGNLIDVPIDHWAAIDMDGFAGMIDALGGLDIYVNDDICDPGYRQLGVREIEAPVGWWHMTGPQALGYARVRHDTGGSDFRRMRRQQDLLLAIRDAIVAAGATEDPLGWLARIPTITTDLPPDVLLAAGALASTIAIPQFNGHLIQPFGHGGTELYDGRGYVLSANVDEIRDEAEGLFTPAGTRPSTGRKDPPPEKPATVPALPRFNGC